MLKEECINAKSNHRLLALNETNIFDVSVEKLILNSEEMLTQFSAVLVGINTDARD